MVDREKVIKALECCAYKQNCIECPYYKGNSTCMDDKDKDALDLLKEQEAVVPIKMQRMDSNFSFFVPYFLCGNCRYELVGEDVMFCSHCGREVKWDD